MANFYLDEGELPSITKLPKGQMLWTEKGSFKWTVPDGVFSICAAVLGAGTRSTSARAGAGGALVYRNDIPVTPGQVLDIVVGSGIVNQFDVEVARSKIVFAGLSAGYGNDRSADDAALKRKGFNGGGYFNVVAGADQPVQRWWPGGDAATYTANGITHNQVVTQSTPPLAKLSKGFDLATGQPVDATTQEGGRPGGGGSGVKLKSVTGAYEAFPGAVRIMWGRNRAFPSTNILDQ